MMRSPPDRRGLRIALACIVGACGVAGLTLAVTLSLSRELQVDEIEHVHAAYNVAQGRMLYVDFWQGHHPAIYAVLAPLIDPEAPGASFTRARALMLLVWLGSLTLAGIAARQLTGRDEALWLTAGLLLLHSTFVERGLEIRPDGWLAFLSLGALVLELARGPVLARRAAQGLLLGVAFLFTKKAALPCLAFGVLWLIDALRSRSSARVLLPCLVWSLPVGLSVLSLIQAGSLDEFLHYNVRNQAQLVGRTALQQATFGPWRFLSQEGARNLLFSAAALLGLGHAVWNLARSGAGRDSLAATVWVTAVMLSALWLAPQPFPYLHVSLLPFVAILAGRALLAVVETWNGQRIWMRLACVALALPLAGASSAPRIAEKARATRARQLALVEEVQRITEPDEPVFDLVGLYFRPDAYPVYLMTGIMFARYQAGGFPSIAEHLRRKRPAAIILNYRTRWLSGADGEFIRDHYVHYTDNLFVQGRRVDGLLPGESIRFEVLRQKSFRYQGDGVLLVDGAPFERGVLAAGTHELSAAQPVSEGLLIHEPPGPAPGPPAPPRPLYTPFD
jgi:hypothetical protein